MRPHTLLALCVALGTGPALTACGKKDAADGAASPSTSATASTAGKSSLDPDDPCRLLSAAEAQAVLGAPLGTPPYRASPANTGTDAGTPKADSDACWYETAGHKNLSIALTRTGGGAGANLIGGFLAKAEGAANFKLQDGSELTGEWDEVKVIGCCTFMALRGDTLVEVDTGGTEATPAQIAQLADAAIKRLEAPLDHDGGAAQTAAATAFQARRPAGLAPCAVLSTADVEAVLGKVKGEPKATGNECTWEYASTRNALERSNFQEQIPKDTMSKEDMKMLEGFMGAMGAPEVTGGSTESLVIATTWRNGYRNYRSENAMYGSLAKGLGADLGDAGVKIGEGEKIAGPWEMAQLSKVQFSAVKDDVQVVVRPSNLERAKLQALVTRVYANAAAATAGSAGAGAAAGK